MKPKRSRNRRGDPREAERTIPAKRTHIPEIFDIPGSALAGITHIEMAENREAVVDGCQGVVEYDENVIRLSTGKMVVKFTGRNLQIRILTHDSAVVSGFIAAIEFIP